MDHDRAVGIVVVDTHDRKPRGPVACLFFDDIEAAVRKEKLLQPPRVREICPDQTLLIVALDEETVGTPDKAGVEERAEGTEEIGHWGVFRACPGHLDR
jgi:hypothetical protein